MRTIGVSFIVILVVPLVGSVVCTGSAPQRHDAALKSGARTRSEELRSELGTLAGRFGTGAYEEACREYRRIMAEVQTLDDQVLRGKAVWAVANCWLLEGRYDQALRSFLSVRTLLTGSGDISALAAIHVNLGTLYQELGDLEAAEASLQNALKLAAQSRSPCLSHALIDLANSVRPMSTF